jgi:uncharacterized protein YndB with AHSA1/START domain
MAGDERTGEVDVLAAGVQRRFRRRWSRPVGDVWAALTEPDRLARWIGTYDGLREPGGAGTFTMTHEAEPGGEPMRVVACAAPVRLVVEWDTEGGWRVELDLDQDGADTELVFTQLFAPGTDVVDYALGWHWYLDKLDAEVTGAPTPPPWEEFLAATGPAYGRG